MLSWAVLVVPHTIGSLYYYVVQPVKDSTWTPSSPVTMSGPLLQGSLWQNTVDALSVRGLLCDHIWLPAYVGHVQMGDGNAIINKSQCSLCLFVFLLSLLFFPFLFFRRRPSILFQPSCKLEHQTSCIPASTDFYHIRPSAASPETSLVTLQANTTSHDKSWPYAVMWRFSN